MADNTLPDPAGRAAPILGRSSFDPVKFVEGLSKQRQLASQQRKQERIKGIADQQKKFDQMEIDAWEDEKGYEELVDEKQKLEDYFMTTSQAGFDITNPTSKQEYLLSKQFSNRMDGLNKKIDFWGVQKEKVKGLQEEINKQYLLPEEERTMDISKAEKFINEYINVDGIENRVGLLNTWDFYKEQPLQRDELSESMLDGFKTALPEADRWFTTEKDDITGKTKVITKEGFKPGKVRAGLRKVYNQRSDKQRKAIDDWYTKETKGEVDFNDWLVKTFAPEFADREDYKEVGGGGLSNYNFLPGKSEYGLYDLSGFSSIKTYGREEKTIIPGNKREPATEQITTVKDQYNSVATIPLQAVFKNKFIPMTITSNAINAETGKIAENTGSAAGQVPVDVSFLPVAKKDMTLIIDENKPALQIKAGQRLNIDQQRAIDTKIQEGDTEVSGYSWEPFVNTLVTERMVEGEQGEFAAGLGMRPDTKSINTTNVVPYRELKKQMHEAARVAKSDFAPVDKAVMDIYSQLNSDIFEEISKQKERNYNELEL